MILPATITHCAVQLTKDGVFCPVKTWYGQPLDPVTSEPLDRSPRWNVLLNGEFIDPDQLLIIIGWDGPESDMASIKGKPITEDEYLHLLEVRAWAVAHSPASPEANPRKAVDLMMAPLPF